MTAYDKLSKQIVIIYIYIIYYIYTTYDQTTKMDDLYVEMYKRFKYTESVMIVSFCL